MNKMQEQVAEFHQAFGVPIGNKPCLIPLERALLRASLNKEECHETDCAIVNQDLIEIADGIADTIYVLIGAAIEYGIDIQAVFDEVHRSNMSKLWTRDEWQSRSQEFKETHSFSYDDQYKGAPMRGDVKILSVLRSDGKVIKSPSYSPADIQSVLEKLKGK